MQELLNNMIENKKKMEELYSQQKKLVEKAVKKGATWRDIAEYDKNQAIFLCKREKVISVLQAGDFVEEYLLTLNS